MLRLRPDRSLPPDEQLLASTRLGGSGDDFAMGLSLEPPGSISLLGPTSSPNFPVTGDAFQSIFAGDTDVFAARLSLSLDTIQYATFLGGSGYDGAFAGTTDRDGRFYLCGMVTSGNFPVSPGAFKVNLSGERDGFFSILDPRQPPADQLQYSTYLGGSGWDETWDVVLADDGYAFITGYTGGMGFEAGGDPGTFDDTFGGISDAFIARFSIWPPQADFTVTPASGEAPLEVLLDAAGSTTPPGTTLDSYSWDFGDGATATGPTSRHTFDGPGRYTITLTVVNDRHDQAVHRLEVIAHCPPGEVASWSASDIGAPRFPGSSWKDGDCVSLCAGGKGIGGTADEGHLLYREARGDLVLTAQITELSGGGSGAGAGLMLRESLDPTARFAALLLEKGAARFRARPALSKGKTANDLPLWVRLERTGDEFIGSISPDGCAWTEVGRKTIGGFPEAMLAGLAATGRDPGGPGISPFKPIQARICVADPPPCGPRFRRGDANGDGGIDLSDAVKVLAYLFLGDPAPACLVAADVDGSGKIDITDAVYTLQFLFLGGPSPKGPFPDCGIDDEIDGLGCQSFSPCQ